MNEDRGVPDSIEEVPEGNPDVIRVDLDTPLEQVFLGLTIVCGLGCLLNLFGGRNDFALNCFLGAAIAGVVYWGTDCTYFVDRKQRRVDFSRRVIVLEQRHCVASFDDVALTSVNGRRRSTRHSTWWEYATVIVLKTGKTIRVSDWLREDVTRANNRASWLSRDLDVECEKAPAHRKLSIVVDPLSGAVQPRFEQWTFFSALSAPVAIGMVIALVLINLMEILGW